MTGSRQGAYAVVPADGVVASGLGLGILAPATVGVGVASHTMFRVRDV